MNLTQLLDTIDSTAPRECRTCLYMATHTQCDGCLYATDEERQARGYQYHNWVPGNWLRELDRAQRAGEQCIVIGGQGEADFYATSKPQKVAKHLRYVAGECGYLVGNLRGKSTPETTLQVITHEGHFSVVWDTVTAALLRIDQIAESGEVSQDWPEVGV